MPAAIRVKLNEEEDRTLKELCCANGVPERTKQRALVMRLNAHGWNTAQIAQFLDWHEHTVRAALKRWKTKGLGGLWEEKGRGRKCSWNEAHVQRGKFPPLTLLANWQLMEQWLEEPRRYSAAQLQQKWQEHCGVNLGAEQVRRIVKKKAMSGNGYASVQQLQSIHKQYKLNV